MKMMTMQGMPFHYHHAMGRVYVFVRHHHGFM